MRTSDYIAHKLQLHTHLQARILLQQRMIRLRVLVFFCLHRGWNPGMTLLIHSLCEGPLASKVGSLDLEATTVQLKTRLTTEVHGVVRVRTNRGARRRSRAK
jgi:hypothetical protein